VISSSPPNASAPEKRHALRHPTAGETTLYLVRHGRTESNQRNVMVGITDVPLDAVGVGQARAIAERLASEVDADVLLASPLSRAFETARIIGARIGLTPVARPDVVEIDFGDLEGVSIDRFLEDHSSLWLRMLDDADQEVGWPDGESRHGFQQRVRAAFQSILEEYAHHRVIVVTHGGVIGAFLASVLGLSPNAPEAWDIANCSLSHLDVDASGTWVRAHNDTVHLEVLAEPDDDVAVIA
jgi:probable phosphoglycerate mutase